MAVSDKVAQVIEHVKQGKTIYCAAELVFGRIATYYEKSTKYERKLVFQVKQQANREKPRTCKPARVGIFVPMPIETRDFLYKLALDKELAPTELALSIIRTALIEAKLAA